MWRGERTAADRKQRNGPPPPLQAAAAAFLTGSIHSDQKWTFLGGAGGVGGGASFVFVRSKNELFGVFVKLFLAFLFK